LKIPKIKHRMTALLLNNEINGGMID